MEKPRHYFLKDLPHPPSFKNSKQLSFKGRRPLLITQPRVSRWMRVVIKKIAAQRKHPPLKRQTEKQKQKAEVALKNANRVSIVVGASSLRLADLDGMVATLMDCLVRAGALGDDAPRYVSSIHADIEYSKETFVKIKIAKRRQRQKRKM